MICFPEEKFSLLIENLDNSIYKGRRTRSRSEIFQIGEDNIVLMYIVCDVKFSLKQMTLSFNIDSKFSCL